MLVSMKLYYKIFLFLFKMDRSGKTSGVIKGLEKLGKNVPALNSLPVVKVDMSVTRERLALEQLTLQGGLEFHTLKAPRTAFALRIHHEIL